MPPTSTSDRVLWDNVEKPPASNWRGFFILGEYIIIYGQPWHRDLAPVRSFLHVFDFSIIICPLSIEPAVKKIQGRPA